MTTRMLIDAAHPEETRVVVVRGNRLEEFDFETSTKKQLKGNIYLAKVTRVEPSLQAAFVDYGGNRHGFLAFNEIHPDYYQIPIADREALLAEEAASDAAERAEADAAADAAGGTGAGDDAELTAPEPSDPDEAAIAESTGSGGDGTSAGETRSPTEVEAVGGDEVDEVTRRRARTNRRYKIQEVIKRRQILLVQVVKEERGTKGGALTTYVSLAGRHCVLMPNTARGGGISRKIVSAPDRKRLKSIVNDLSVPEGMGLIVRTAGAQRSKAEIRRDYDFLLRHWDTVRELTLNSTAPALVHEEANLIKRSIRDLYTKDIDQVLVEGDEGYKTAKAFMRMLMPSHAARVQPYRDRVPLFHSQGVEQQFDPIHSPVVHLNGGGYIVISPTEALVSVDVNSGRATKERNIEETAVKTNLEAAVEVARQLRLRDLAGLIVIDFIDMDEGRNNRAVERRIKESLKSDRARIQVGRISAFGLLEMSRQRLRPSLIEASTDVCERCGGAGHVRSTESSALQVLRAIEDEGIRESGAEITVHVATPIAIYLLNHKRASVADIERRYDFTIIFFGDDKLVPPEHRIDRLAKPSAARVEAAAEAPAGEEGEAEGAATEEDSAEAAGKRRRRGKRGGRRRSKRGGAEEVVSEATPAPMGESEPVGEDEPASEGELVAEAAAPPTAVSDESPPREGKPAKRRRRSRARKPKTDADMAVAADDSDAAPPGGNGGSAEAGPVEVPATAGIPWSGDPAEVNVAAASPSTVVWSSESEVEQVPSLAAEREAEPMTVEPPAIEAAVSIQTLESRPIESRDTAPSDEAGADAGVDAPTPSAIAAEAESEDEGEKGARRRGWWRRVIE